MARGEVAEERGKETAIKNRIINQAFREAQDPIDRNKPGESAGADKPGKPGKGK